MIWRGVVKRVNGASVYVEVPRLRQGFQYGPCLVAVPTTPLLDSATDSHGADGSGLHVTPLTRHTLDVGARVLCALLEDDPDSLVVLGRVSG